ncbi:MAG: hypothetical protein JWO05_2669 [Gemmatimonadetes bacterium]|nr:hypothetical protein [Gemmatimonadota bacterium]
MRRPSIRWIAPLLLLPALIACSRERRNDDAWSASQPLAAGTRLHVRNLNGDVRLVSGTSFRARGGTVWHHRGDAQVQFQVVRSGNDVYVCALWSRNGSCGPNYQPNYRGRHSFLGLATWGSDARASIDVVVPPGVDVDASTVNGDLVVSGVDAGLEAGTVNGSVRATIPGTFAGSVELNTVNGSATTDFPLVASSVGSDKRHLAGTIGTGTGRVLMKTVNGSVSLRKG